ncbi:MAG: glycosyltransferase family 4 protein [Candidatus Terrybacteria bacterium]|nr:glycosyltransferase family 4 protein [Candidatus Terrybacteria bacterium]
MSKRKKIIYVITKSFWGGAQRYVYDLATNLPKESFDILVIAGGPPTGGLIKKLKEKNIAFASIPYLERNVNIFSDIKTFFFLLKLFCREKPDIIHLNSSKIGGLGALAGKLAGVKKIIFTAHGWAFNEDRSWLAKKIIKFAVWFSLLLQDKIIAVSTAIIKDASGFPFVSKKFVLIHNGIKESFFFGRDDARKFFEEKLKIKAKPETVWIGTISELHKNKGVKYAIEAMAKINPVRSSQSKIDAEMSKTFRTSNGVKELPFIFIIIGEGEERKNLSLLVTRYELQDNVKLFGYLDEAKKYLPAFDIFTLTSVTEAFPYAVLEAGQAGLAVIASNTGGIIDVIKNKKNGVLTKPKSPAEINTAIRELMADVDLREKFGRNLKKTVEENFSFQKMLEKTLLESQGCRRLSGQRRFNIVYYRLICTERLKEADNRVNLGLG